MAKQIIRLTESDLHRLVKESVQRIIREMAGDGATADPGINADGTGDPSMGVAYPASIVAPNDPSRGRKKGDIAMNKGEKPVGHKG